MIRTACQWCGERPYQILFSAIGAALAIAFIVNFGSFAAKELKSQNLPVPYQRWQVKATIDGKVVFDKVLESWRRPVVCQDGEHVLVYPIIAGREDEGNVYAVPGNAIFNMEFVGYKQEPGVTYQDSHGFVLQPVVASSTPSTN